MDNWQIFRGTNQPHDGIDALPDPPSWRIFDDGPVVPPGADGAESGPMEPAAGYHEHTKGDKIKKTG
ncbi:hypothetical protein ACFXP3_31285, partial [Streptomyces sp. NPDC059096]